MNKKIISLFFLYLIQFIVTSCDPCHEVRTYERKYNGLEVRTWDTSGFQTSAIDGTVNKNSFGLTLLVQSELNQIAYHQRKTSFSGFGFASAYAWSCPDDEYIIVDPIDSIEITVVNTENQKEIMVTDNFTTPGYDGEPITITELFEDRAEWHDSFQFDLTEYDKVPNSSIFKIKVFLESGIELTQETEIVAFEE